MTTEKRLEKRLAADVKKADGLSIKLWPFSFTGLPDRLILLPGGRVVFVEHKSEDGRLSVRQQIVSGHLKRLGFNVWVIWNDGDYEHFKRAYGL